MLLQEKVGSSSPGVLGQKTKSQGITEFGQHVMGLGMDLAIPVAVERLGLHGWWQQCLQHQRWELGPWHGPG